MLEKQYDIIYDDTKGYLPSNISTKCTHIVLRDPSTIRYLFACKEQSNNFKILFPVIVGREYNAKILSNTIKQCIEHGCDGLYIVIQNVSAFSCIKTLLSALRRLPPPYNFVWDVYIDIPAPLLSIALVNFQLYNITGWVVKQYALDSTLSKYARLLCPESHRFTPDNSIWSGIVSSDPKCIHNFYQKINGNIRLKHNHRYYPNSKSLRQSTHYFEVIDIFDIYQQPDVLHTSPDLDIQSA